MRNDFNLSPRSTWNMSRDVCRMEMLSQKHHVQRLFNWMAGRTKRQDFIVLIANHQQMKDLPGMPMYEHFPWQSPKFKSGKPCQKNSTEHWQNNRPWTPQKPKNSLGMSTTFSSHMDAVPQRLKVWFPSLDLPSAKDFLFILFDSYLRLFQGIFINVRHRSRWCFKS